MSNETSGRSFQCVMVDINTGKMSLMDFTTHAEVRRFAAKNRLAADFYKISSISGELVKIHNS